MVDLIFKFYDVICVNGKQVKVLNIHAVVKRMNVMNMLGRELYRVE